jgi:alkanesulfonate monooxygenase SsuD/methylene tetrahydromethanopterin reductase-like flavin-dependent oxidoreductase (luciferase family)
MNRSFLDVARECEDLGYDSMFAFDHVIPIGSPVGTPMLDAFAGLAAAAAVTSSIRLVTLVARAGMRPVAMTVHLARSVAAVADGRFVLGLGSGDADSHREDALLDLPLTARARRTEVLRATVAAVREGVPEVPVWLGGSSVAIRRLASEIADGWNSWATPVEQIANAGVLVRDVTWGNQILVARSAAEADERLASWMPGRGAVEREQAVTGGPAEVAARLLEVAAVGVSECFLSFVGGDAAQQRRLFAAEVLPVLHGHSAG